MNDKELNSRLQSIIIQQYVNDLAVERHGRLVAEATVELLKEKITDLEYQTQPVEVDGDEEHPARAVDDH